MRLCAWGSVAFYFFYGFMIEGEEFSDFTTNENGYNIKVLKPAKAPRKEEMLYAAQNQSLHRAFTEVGVKSSHTTHAGRGSGARIAELNGASLDMIRRMGRWDSGSLENSYLTHFNREAIRICNGFPGPIGSFWLPRAGVEPPLELQEQVFPEIEGWHVRLNDPDDAAYNSSGSALAFLYFMLKLRKLLLQGSVLMRKEDPANSIFKHRIFQSDAYKDFEIDVLAHIETTPTPASMILRDTMSIIEQRLNEVLVEVKTTVAAVEQRSINNHLNTTNDSILEKFQQLQAQITNACPDVGSSAVGSSAVPGSAVSPFQHSATMNIDGIPPAVEASDVMLSKGTCTIKELWEEWMVCDSSATKNMTVEVLNRVFGTKWRNSQKGRKH